MTRKSLVFLVSFVFLSLSQVACKKASTSKSTVVIKNSETQVFDGHLEKWKDFDGQKPTRFAEYPAMLPSYALPGERKKSLKGDQYSDFRAAHPAWYNATIPTNQAQSQFTGMVEWETMQALLLTVSGGAGALPEEVDQNLADMARETILIAGVDVYMLYSSNAHKNIVEGMIYAGAIPSEVAKLDLRLKWTLMDHDSIWMIDYSPFPVKDLNNKISFVDFEYYTQRVLDDAVPTRLGYEVFGVNTFRMPLSLEGGNLQMDSMGTCYITQGVLYFNPAMSESEISDMMASYLGCTQVVIVAPLANEGTTHIDMFFKLVDDHTVIMGEYAQSNDPQNKEVLDTNTAILENLTLPDNQPITVHRMVMPDNENQGNWRTHVNSTFVKGPTGQVNLWPGFDQVNTDGEALAKWQSVMPSWDHVRIKSDTIITWNGAMHCISRTVQTGITGEWIPDGACQNGTCASNNPLAYNGSCNVDTGCSGPKWLGSEGCQGVSYQGCCDGEILYACEDGALEDYNCQGSCGWDTQNNFYNCGKTGEGPASYPIDCPWNQCTPDCAGKQCGDDGCGGTCGNCGLDESCNQGSCVSSPGCDGLTYEGCCSEGPDGFVLKWCEDDEVKTLECDTTCGWSSNSSQPWYLCGAQGDGPAEFPISCDAGCEPQCGANQCGDDGCGGTCGTCSPGSLCQNGNCVCEPTCDGVQCGPDGCGGSCGTCGSGTECAQGQCECAPNCSSSDCGDDGCGGICGLCMAGESCLEGLCIPDAGGCGNVGPEGTCQGRAKITCDNNQVNVEICDDCCMAAPEYASATCVPLSGCPCEPSCVGQQCGDDGCGGSCGTCAIGLSCSGGSCMADCVPSCDGKQCGDDGCGGFCGGCSEGTDCLDGLCQCIPDCRFMQCGGDGCGGSCGTCMTGFTCTAEQTCEGSGVMPDTTSGTDLNGQPGGGGGGSSSGCSAQGHNDLSGPASFFLLSLFGALVLGRRRETLELS